MENAIITREEPLPEAILLPADKSFLITRLDDGFDKRANITCRCPCKVGDSVFLLVATSTISMGGLNCLRVEKNDGLYYVITNSEHNFRDHGTRICVESEKVGYEIIKALISTFAAKKIAKSDLGIPPRLWKLNQQAEELAPAIFTGCALLLSIAGTIWLLFR